MTKSTYKEISPTPELEKSLESYREKFILLKALQGMMVTDETAIKNSLGTGNKTILPSGRCSAQAFEDVMETLQKEYDKNCQKDLEVKYSRYMTPSKFNMEALFEALVKSENMERNIQEHIDGILLTYSETHDFIKLAKRVSEIPARCFEMICEEAAKFFELTKPAKLEDVEKEVKGDDYKKIIKKRSPRTQFNKALK